MSHEHYARSAVKAITWRILGSLDTLVVCWIVTGKLSLAIPVAGVEVFTKAILFFLHERAWNKVRLGRAISG